VTVRICGTTPRSPSVNVRMQFQWERCVWGGREVGDAVRTKKAGVVAAGWRFTGGDQGRQLHGRIWDLVGPRAAQCSSPEKPPASKLRGTTLKP